MKKNKQNRQQQQQQQQQQQAAPPEQTGQQPTSTESPKHCFLVQYRGAVTDQLVRSLYEANAPIQAVVTLRKIRTFVSQLKAKVPEEIASRVVYQITCPSCGACYVGQTCRHARTRLGEHRTKSKEPVRIHFVPCAKRKANQEDMRILHRTTRSREFLETLEALYI